MNINKIFIGGRLTKPTHLKYTPSGIAVCNFSVAVNERWTDKSGQKQEKAEFMNIVVWGKNGENCDKYLDKGSEVFLEGKLTTRSWDDQEGKKQYMTEIIADNVQFIGGQQKGKEPVF